jgi:hypothetical protein
MKRPRIILCAAWLLLGAGCSKKPDEASPTKKAAEPAPTGNVVAIPDSVRTNLGITFAKVTRRVVAGTVRYPGRFEAPPEAVRKHHAPVAGRVTLLVKQFDRVAKGAELFRLEAPRLRELRREIAAAEAEDRVADAELQSLPAYRAAHRAHEEALKGSVELWTKRVADLEALQAGGGVRNDELSAARAELAKANADFAETQEKDADLEARARRVAAVQAGAAARAALLRDELASLLGTPGGNGASAEITGRAANDGVVSKIEVSEGAWADVGAALLEIVDPTRVRFRAAAPQVDLSRLKDGAAVRIVPSVGGGDALRARNGIPAVLRVGIAGDAEERTFDVFAVPTAADPAARPGVVGALEIVPDGATEDLSVERAAVLRDGLVSVFFRRDPKKLDQVLRVEADLGVTDGRYVVIKSGVKEGDEIVLGGAYQLVLATSGTAQKGGHFHADGTFHADGEEEK